MSLVVWLLNAYAFLVIGALALAAALWLVSWPFVKIGEWRDRPRFNRQPNTKRERRLAWALTVVGVAAISLQFLH